MALDLAIVGMAGIFPGAGDVGTFWDNIVHRVDAIRDVPPERFEVSAYFDPAARAVDRLYCRRGGFIDGLATFDPLRFGIMPVTAHGIEPDQLLTLRLAHEALEDAGLLEDRRLLQRAGIIMGRGNYVGAAMARAIDAVCNCQQLLQALGRLLPDITPAQLEQVRREYHAERSAYGPDTALGVVPNLVASRVANRLDMGGPAFTVDAACASSLIAMDAAARDLVSGRCDLMLVGGVHLSQEPTFWSVFTQLGALSRRQEIRPFDRRADGLLAGEGCGVVVLRRLRDAERDGNRIYAVVKGIGVSSDGSSTSLMSPSARGQIEAVRRAWQEAGLGVETVGYVEAHGTATPIGDRTELATLAAVFGPPGSGPAPGLGSVKSMIGHAMPAAGIAGIIKTALALHHRKLPPTLHCEEPHADLATTRFQLVQEARDWGATDLPARAGVNAFGFGGINAHVVLEGHGAAAHRPRRPAGATPEAEPERLLLLARQSPREIVRALERGDAAPGDGPCRLALFDPTPARLDRARAVVERGAAWRGKQDLWFSPGRLLARTGSTAFLFPGVDGLAWPEVASVADAFGLPRPPHLDTEDPFEAAIRLYETERLFHQVLRQVGVRPGHLAGHSQGEWTACAEAGLVVRESVPRVLAELQRAGWNHPDVVFLSAGTRREVVEPLLAGLKVFVSHDNCPHQVVLCGTSAQIDACRERMAGAGILHQLMPFRSGLHTPFFAEYLAPFEAVLPRLELRAPEVPLWSGTTASRYPARPEDVRELMRRQLVSTVRFRDLTRALFDAGARVFVQVGPGGLLGFVGDTLAGEEILAVATCSPKRTGIRQLRRVAAAVFVEGQEVAPDFLMPPDRARARAAARPAPAAARGPIRLQLFPPVVKGFTPLPSRPAGPGQPAAAPADGGAESLDDRVLRVLHENRRVMEAAQQDVLALLAQARTGAPAAPGRPRREPATAAPREAFSRPVELSVERYPELADHCLCKNGPPGRTLEETYPVVPLTMTIQLLSEVVRELAPERRIVALESIDAQRWVDVARPFRGTIQGRWLAPDRVRVALEGHASMEVILGDRLPEPPRPALDDVGAPRPIPISAREFYDRTYMFHGPAYQGLRSLDRMGDRGIQGVVAPSGGKGSLLDNAGQLYGLWIQLNAPRDRMAFPVHVDRIQFFGDVLRPAGEFRCTCGIRSMEEDFVVGDFELVQEGKVWARVTGWRDRRFETDDAWWGLFVDPLQNTLSQEIAPGVFAFHKAYRQQWSWRFVESWYLAREERATYAALPPAQQKSWLVARIAAKDALRVAIRRSRGSRPYPSEIRFGPESNGVLHVEGMPDAKLRVHLARTPSLAVAAVRAEGEAFGVEVQAEEAADPGDLLDAAERRLLAGADPADLLRCLAAKRLHARVMGGDPRPGGSRVEERREDRFRIGSVWLRTALHRNHVIGWTDQP